MFGSAYLHNHGGYVADFGNIVQQKGVVGKEALVEKVMVLNSSKCLQGDKKEERRGVMQ